MGVSIVWFFTYGKTGSIDKVGKVRSAVLHAQVVAGISEVGYGAVALAGAGGFVGKQPRAG